MSLLKGRRSPSLSNFNVDHTTSLLALDGPKT